jgi:hypothetical protein
MRLEAAGNTRRSRWCASLMSRTSCATSTSQPTDIKQQGGMNCSIPFMVGCLSLEEPPMRIPSRVILPFGYRISVRQLSDSEMDRRDPNADGIWDDELKVIYLRKRLPVTRRRYILAHELGHAWLDWQHRHLDNGKAKS